MLWEEKLNWGTKPFFNVWLKDQGFDDVVKDAFLKAKMGNKRRGIGGLLKDTKHAIQRRSRSNMVDYKKNFVVLEKEISELDLKLQASPCNIEINMEISKARAKLWKLYRNEERLKEGNNVINEPRIVKEKVRDHFEKAYNKKIALDIEDMCFGFKKLNREQGGNLERAFSEDEI
ncbi:hypothetical protein V6N13_107782 [Hibiscus sabdariffa]